MGGQVAIGNFPLDPAHQVTPAQSRRRLYQAKPGAGGQVRGRRGLGFIAITAFLLLPAPTSWAGESGGTVRASAGHYNTVDEIERLVRDHDVGFFILADEEPTINRKKFIQFCEELIARGLPDKVKWGINTRVTDIMRDKELLPLYRKAGLVHVSLGTEAAAQLKLDQFNKETKVEDNSV